jgi:hypothetical protein
MIGKRVADLRRHHLGIWFSWRALAANLDIAQGLPILGARIAVAANSVSVWRAYRLYQLTGALRLTGLCRMAKLVFAAARTIVLRIR